ncbi:hypothetical protein HYFRA_00008025 [Hymenoscyphus fraxineus]|uniref:ABC transporter domain-containing protein n=1 Tax=Hymenoscyphus fraxineus TaxID=746836 RepID=A0A9N9PLL5_9HELO|nr:hypothetical protein HYFRA_00008025 [Hymenoscyphus fraxineus]
MGTFQPSQWRRIYRQTLTLMHKNFLIFSKAPISTTLRCLIFPIAATLVFVLLKHIGDTDSYGYTKNDWGIANSTFPVKDLASAITASSSQKLIFVRNGLAVEEIDSTIKGVLGQPGMEAVPSHIVDNPNELFDLCKQSLQGHSDCFAAVIFQISNETTIEYTIAVDNSFVGSYDSYGSYQDDKSKTSQTLLPLQWALNSHLGGFSTVSRPSVQPRGGNNYASTYEPPPSSTAELWLSIISTFVAPVFILILIGVVYHLAIFVAAERESSMSELMAAQKVSITPRVLSTFLSFFILYFPGFLISSILMTQILFTKTSDILVLFLTLLAGASTITSAHFLASFFRKAQLAGLYTSTLVTALSLVTLCMSLTVENPSVQVTALSAVFPPIAWATLIGDIARREYYQQSFSLAQINGNQKDVDGFIVKYQIMSGYLYILFFILQTVLYSAATYAVERGLWGVTRKYTTIDATSDVAVRCTSLSKTYNAKRRWYFPFLKKGKSVRAVDSLNLEVKKGSVTFLLGPNGGGKTTTLKCIAGMTTMNNGSQLELNEAGLVFGICPQNNVFWDELSVQEHIQIWRKLKTAAVDDLTADNDDVIMECDLLEKTRARAKTLSGGQMRKLQLAIAFVGGSNVVAIDEASSGLDPLSRRNIWNIIQKGHARRSVLVTTHFLDEADVLADHIAIVYKGKLVCEGPAPSLKAAFGEKYLIRSNEESDGETEVHQASNSADATKMVQELERATNNTYSCSYPTLEQVFLKVTSESSAAIRQAGGDGIIGDGVASSTTEKEEPENFDDSKSPDLALDVGQSIGFLHQVKALLGKRYALLTQKAGWISYGINLIIPIIIAAAVAKYVLKYEPIQTCATNSELLRNPSLSQSSTRLYSDSETNQRFGPLTGFYSPSLYNTRDSPVALLGPAAQFSGDVQNELYVNGINTFASSSYTNSSPSSSSQLGNRVLVNSSEALAARLSAKASSSSYRSSSNIPVPIWAPTPQTAVFFYDTAEDMSGLSANIIGFNYLTYRIANATNPPGGAKMVVTYLRTMRTPANVVNGFAMPLSALIVIAFIACTSISVIYPVYERVMRVRALQYCNGVSPAALWVAYLLFDMQFIFIQAIFVYGLLYASVPHVYYQGSYIFGAFILFGIATYLGCYLLSLFVKKAAFAIAAGVHVLLFICYLLGYVGAQSTAGPKLFETYSALQYGLGLTSPAANLARALWVATNSFEILCGKYGDADVSRPFAYVRYGSVYCNLILQILFLTAMLIIHEYGSADWVRRNITQRGLPPHLSYIVESSNSEALAGLKNTGSSTTSPAEEILTVSHLTKYFNKLSAVEDVSFSINSNSTLALLGGNGAGKTTVINMIRGVLVPNFGSITLDNINVLTAGQKARIHMGVCPQDDAIDNLTVYQTLRFYGCVKGLKNVEGNVEKVLEALKITTFRNYTVAALSGGTRRKLSVAIALLGNPRVLLLDEPSTGQDAGAKRILWKTLKDISANRAILLTTHSMEEAEALATGVAIMGTKMLATGTLSELQVEYGGMYMIRAVRAPGTNASNIEGIVRETFSGVRNYQDGCGQISFNLPFEKKELGSIMRRMEGLKGEGVDVQVGVKVISDYTINSPSLEEVFMNVAREAGATVGV